MKRFRWIFIGSIAFLAFCGGMAATQFKWYPWRVVEQTYRDIEAFVEGHPEEKNSSAIEKFLSDRGGIPYRKLERDISILKTPADATPFLSKEIGLYLSGFYRDVPEGYFLLSGYFNFKGSDNHGYVLINTKGQYIRRWLRGGQMSLALDIPRGRFISGHWSHPWCGRPVFRGVKRIHDIHHSVEIAPDGTYWGNTDDGFAQYHPNKIHQGGVFKRLRHFTIRDIIRKNPQISPLQARIKIWWSRKHKRDNEKFSYKMLYDPFHHNDVQPFSDPRFPTKLGYALAISVRNQNLIMVIDPSSLKVLWFVQGVTQYQHDVDYHDGYLYAYDNGIFRGYSRLIRFPLDKGANPFMHYEVVVDGRKHDWAQPVRGSYELIERGQRRYFLFTYDKKAAVMMIDDQGREVFALQNRLNIEPKHGIRIKAVKYISPEDYESLEARCKR